LKSWNERRDSGITIAEKTLHLSAEAVKFSTGKSDPGGYRRGGRTVDGEAPRELYPRTVEKPRCQAYTLHGSILKLFE